MTKAIILEDDFIIGLYISNELKKANIEVAATLDKGEDLAKSVDEHSPDLLIVDVKLNGVLDGIDAVNNLSDEKKPAVVFITGSSTGKTCERIRELNPLAMLSKPFNSSDFQPIVHQIMQPQAKYGNSVQN